VGRLTRDEGYELLRETIDAYTALAGSHEARGSTYTEAAARADFIDKLLEALGWDLANEDGLVEREREVSIERTGADGVEGLDGRPDYTLRIDGRLRMFWEAKKPSVDIVRQRGPAFQLRTYGWTARLPVSVVTNFRTLAIYDTRGQPADGDEAFVARRPDGLFGIDDYLPRFDDLWRMLSRESVAGPAYEEVYGVVDLRGADGFDQRFLAQIRGWRLALARVAHGRDPHSSPAEVGRRVQRILNRLLFLRICEERGLERYERLRNLRSDAELADLLHEADRIYNAGLFSLADQDAWSIGDLRPVVEELYYPRSPFAFGVLDSETLAEVYDQFLGEQVEVDGDELRLVEKPEIKHAGGVVPTPIPIVDALLDRALAPEIARLRREGAVGGFTVCDPACGSGVFLIRAYQRLIDALEAGTGAMPDLAAKRRLMLEAIWGVDIDSAAVEVARFGLVLALLDGETPTRLAGQPKPLLPDIDANVTHGNSLIDFDFDRFLPGRLDDPEVLDEVAPFDWRTTPAGKGGFDAIVCNPPYVRIQVLAEYAPLQLLYFQSPSSPYASSQAYNFDKYLLFVERALTLLAGDGLAAFIVPHRFLTSLPGTALRGALATRVRELVNFGTEQVFPGRTTYTCLLTLAARPGSEFEVEIVDDLAAWQAGAPGARTTKATKELGPAPWDVATTDRAAAVFDRLRRDFPVRLADVADIFVGVQTSADKVFFVTDFALAGDGVDFVDQDGAQWTIEAAITRPALLDRSLEPHLSRPRPDARAIFPYTIEIGATGRARAVLIPPERMLAEYPKAWAYLSAHKHRLVPPARSPSPYRPEGWYCYGRSQSLTKLDGDKIIVRVLSREPQYCFDPDGLLVPGGGDGGPYYLIRPKPDSSVDIHYLIALLSHPVIDRIVVAGGRTYRGGYYVHRKQFLAGIPVPRDPREAEIARQAANLGELVAAIRDEPAGPARESKSRLRDARRETLEELVAAVLGLTAAECAALDE
jgi:Eco57I restriction-modification methylase